MQHHLAVLPDFEGAPALAIDGVPHFRMADPAETIDIEDRVDGIGDKLCAMYRERNPNVCVQIHASPNGKKGYYCPQTAWNDFAITITDNANRKTARARVFGAIAIAKKKIAEKMKNTWTVTSDYLLDKVAHEFIEIKFDGIAETLLGTQLPDGRLGVSTRNLVEVLTGVVGNASDCRATPLNKQFRIAYYKRIGLRARPSGLCDVEVLFPQLVADRRFPLRGDVEIGDIRARIEGSFYAWKQVKIDLAAPRPDPVEGLVPETVAEEPVVETVVEETPVEAVTEPDLVASTNDESITDGRSLRKSGRVHQVATRITEERARQIRSIAERDGIMIAEVLERAVDAYEKAKSSATAAESEVETELTLDDFKTALELFYDETMKSFDAAEVKDGKHHKELRSFLVRTEAKVLSLEAQAKADHLEDREDLIKLRMQLDTVAADVAKIRARQDLTDAAVLAELKEMKQALTRMEQRNTVVEQQKRPPRSKYSGIAQMLGLRRA
jgi:hypothetical protein